MTRLLILALIITCTIACNTNERPKDILPEAKMESVIWDMVQADEFITNFVLKDSAKVNVNAERYKLYDRVFALHKTSREQFKKSYEYYISQPGTTRKMYDSLSVRASRRIQDSYKRLEAK